MALAGAAEVSGRVVPTHGSSWEVQVQRMRAYDYSPIANGQVFVARNWLSDELLQALRADVHGLLGGGKFHEADERSVAGLHEQGWSSVNGQPAASEARAAARALFEALRLELELVLQRRAPA